ncbi:MAG: polyprenol monophosphomannose synthase [Deltaproteobacteria bacterium]|nr:polyprenol monophosphomannose synthase [Deltaproteobacteria bacterium]
MHRGLIEVWVSVVASELVILPTYCERENIGKLIPLIFRYMPQAHVLVIDDHSPDQTVEVVRELQKEYEGRLFYKVRPGKLGLGTAYIEGFHFALEKGYSFIFEMDADFSHSPADLPRLRKRGEKCDVVLGSRYIRGGGVKNWGVGRQILSRGGNLYARALLRLPLRDLTGGFKCFRKEVLMALPLNEIKSEGYAFQVELTYRAFLGGFHIEEVPILFVDRKAGRSKMSRRIVAEALWRVWQLRGLAKS